VTGAAIPGLWDHALALVFGIAFPAMSFAFYDRRRTALRAGEAGIRPREYRDTILGLSAMGACTLLLWWARGRRWDELGLVAAVTPAFLTVAAATVAMIGFLAYQLRLVQSDPRARASVRRQLAGVEEFMPTTPRELRAFTAVSASAAVGEELFYRGFLLFYLGSIMPPAAGVAASSAVFALAHAMHGPSAALRAGLLGVLLCGIYLWTGTLWLPMLLHGSIDWFSGRAAYTAFVSVDTSRVPD